MAKIRKDLVGTVLAVNESQQYKSLTAGEIIPAGYFVGGHAVEGGDVRDQTPPWARKAAAPAEPSGSTPGILESLIASGAAPEEILVSVAEHLGVEIPALEAAEGAEAEGNSETVENAAPLSIPPKAGAGSSADAWRDYAAKAVKAAGLNIDIPADAKRDDIIEALEGAKIPTE